MFTCGVNGTVGHGKSGLDASDVNDGSVIWNGVEDCLGYSDLTKVVDVHDLSLNFQGSLHTSSSKNKTIMIAMR